MDGRPSGQSYPIFITDLDLPPSLFAEYADGNIPSSDFLNYKKNIESKLNDALKSLSAAGRVHQLKPRQS